MITKKYLYISLGMMLGLISCQSEDMNRSQGNGYIQLSAVDIDKSITSRSGNEAISVKISGSDGTIFQEAEDWTQLQGQEFLVPAGGVYTVEAFSANKTLAEGFEAEPYYSGSEEVTVKANTSHTVSVECKLAQSLVKITYSDKFKSHFSDYSSTLIGSNGSNIVFEANEEREAYVKSGQSLNVDLTLTPNGGQATSINKIIAENANPAYRYNVNFDVNTDGDGNITVSVDVNRNEYEITLGVPVKPDGVTTIPISGNFEKVWGKFAYLSGLCSLVDSPLPVEFKYKKTDDSEWQTISAEKVADTEYEYTAKLTSLDFGTQYQYKIVCGDSEGEVLTFTTEEYVEIPNLNFDTWSQSGKNWFANADAADSYWATGNTGVTSFLAGSKDPITTRSSDSVNGYAAEMHTITGITLVGAASGNLFIGSYKTNMSKPSASVSFGRPYTGARPTSLKGYYKYYPKQISNDGTVPGNLTTDECNIYLKLWDSDNNEIGFGEFVGKEEVNTYTPFEFKITYSRTDKAPAKIAIVATSSHYGGEFEGSKVVGQVGAGSQLFVDEFSLSYE